MNVSDCGKIAYVFKSRLGWITVVVDDTVLKRLSFGHSSQIAAVKALSAGICDDCRHVEVSPGGQLSKRTPKWHSRLVTGLMNYAEGVPVDFGYVKLDLNRLRPFSRRVIDNCRKIKYGKTLSYGDLAREAGSPAAARAVGSCMANNRTPLVVPCHRVVRNDGTIGPYSGVGGASTKRKLLQLEATGGESE